MALPVTWKRSGRTPNAIVSDHRHIGNLTFEFLRVSNERDSLARALAKLSEPAAVRQVEPEGIQHSQMLTFSNLQYATWAPG